VRRMDKRTLWLRWVAANALGEMLGLGMTFGVDVLVFSRLGDQQSVGIVLVSFLFAVASGAIEATLVGLGQWWAMHPWFPMITRRTWWLATLAGALVAYILGYLPYTHIFDGSFVNCVNPDNKLPKFRKFVMYL